MAKILVTGATGYIGAAFSAAARHHGHEVTLGVRSPDRVPAELAGFATRVYGDLSCVGDFRPLLDGHDVVVHAAAAAHGRYSTPERTGANVFDQDAEVVARLTAASCDVGLQQLLLLSSIAVHSQPQPGDTITEASVPSPATPYGAGKLKAEKYLARGCAGSTTRWTVVRPAMVYGADAPGNFTKLLRAVSRGLPLPLRSVRNRRSMLSIDHLVDLMLLAVLNAKASDQVFVVADASPISTAMLVEAIAKGLGRRPRSWPMPVAALRLGGRLAGAGAIVSSLVDDYVIDSSKAVSHLAWRPAADTTDEIRRYVARMPAPTQPPTASS